MSLFPWLAWRKRAPRPSQFPRRWRSAFEALEPRLAMANLGLGIRVLEDNGGSPGAPRTAPLVVGGTYWIEVLAEDRRDSQDVPQGIISLPLNLSWDSDNIELLNEPTSFFPSTIAPANLVTSSFPLGRFVDAFDDNAGHQGFVEPPPAGPVTPPADPNLDSLRGAALPQAGSGQAIGIPPDVGFFSQLQFRAKAAGDDTPFTLQLAGSMSFADAEALDGVIVLSNSVRQVRTDTRPAEKGPMQGEVMNPLLSVTEFIEIVAAPLSSSLSGFVYADTNRDSVLNTSAAGAHLELGLPNVTIQLFGVQGTTPLFVTTTGPDGWYHFENLEAGTFRLHEVQPAGFVNSRNSVGTIVSPTGSGPGTGMVVLPNSTDTITGIALAAGEHGIDYNFGDNKIPTKNDLRSRTVPRIALNSALGVKTAIVSPSAASDAIDVQITADEIVVTPSNGAPKVFERGVVDVVVINALASQEVTVTSSDDEDEVAQFLPGMASLRVGRNFLGTNYGVLVLGGEKTTVTAGTGGEDLALIRDTRQTSDSLSANGSVASLATRMAIAMSFNTVRAITTSPGLPTEDDTADVNSIDYVLELLGKWRQI